MKITEHTFTEIKADNKKVLVEKKDYQKELDKVEVGEDSLTEEKIYHKANRVKKACLAKSKKADDYLEIDE